MSLFIRYHQFWTGRLHDVHVTLLNVSEIRDISNDERKVPFKNDEYLASGTSSFRKACKSYIRDNKI